MVRMHYALQKHEFRKNESRLYASWLTKTFRKHKSTKVWMTINKTFRKHKSTKVWMTHKNIPQTRKLKTKVTCRYIKPVSVTSKNKSATWRTANTKLS